MADSVDLEAPELDLDHDAPTFKRVVALAVVLVTLLGSVVAYLQAVESNKEDVAAREAQRNAVAGLGDQVDASATLAADLRIGATIEVQVQRQAVNAARVDALDGTLDDTHIAAANRFAAVAEAIAGQTPIDPAAPDTISARAADLDENPDVARLRQGVEAERANDHGGKADAYVAVLTVLAVALFLMGLSLTVQGRSRYILVAPGVLIGVVCVAWTGLIASRDITDVSRQSVNSTAAGLARQNAGDFEGAIDAYDNAIRDSPEYAVAHARRAAAHFLAGSLQTGQTSFTSITSDEALEAAIEDLDATLDLGADSDVNTVADAGFFSFLAGDFERSAELSSEAIELNDRLAPVWFNLGLAHVAQGNEDDARRAYREGFQVLEAVPDSGTQSAVVAGARTDLSVLREILDDDELDDVLDLIVATEVRLVEFELEGVTCDGEACPEVDVGDVELGDASFSRTGEDVNAVIPVDGLDPGDPVASAWYFRTDDDLPFEQTFQPFNVRLVADDGTVTTGTQPSGDPPCPVAGEYLVRLYAGGEFLGEAQGTIEPSIVGETFTVFNDPIEGVFACVPDGYEITRADVSDLDSFTTFGGPDEDVLIGVNVTPGVNLDLDPETQLRGAIDGIVPGITATQVNLFGTDLDGSLVTIDGLMAVDESAEIAVAAAIGPDARLRVVLLTGVVSEELLFETVGLVTFTGVDTGSG